MKRLHSVVAALYVDVTRLTGKKPSDAIKAKTLTQKPSSVVPGRPLGLKAQKPPSGVGNHYLYQPSELEGGRRPATDPVWSLQVYRLGRSVTKPDDPVLHYLQGNDAHSEALFEKSCLRYQRTPSFLRMGSSGVEQLLNVIIHPRTGLTSRRDRIPLSICQRVYPMLAIQRLESSWGSETCRRGLGSGPCPCTHPRS